MSSGLGFEENYAAPSDATQMLFRKKGAGAYALLSKAANEPDKVWSYSSGTSNILQEIIRRQFATQKDYFAFPHQRLFHKIGMKSAVLEPDAELSLVLRLCTQRLETGQSLANYICKMVFGMANACFQKAG